MRLQEWDLKIIYWQEEKMLMQMPSRQEWFEKHEIPKDILHAKEQNQAS